MNEILITGYGLSTMCRLCLTSDVNLLDIFRFSTKMRDNVAAIIMKCAPIQITKGDEMPNFICRLCYVQLAKSHRFQMQVIQSEKTLQQYLKQLHAFDKQITSEASFVHNSNADATVKCESIELHDFFDMDVNKKEKGPVDCNKINGEMTLKSVIKDEPTDDDFLSLTERSDDTEYTLPKSPANEISCEDSKIDIEDTKWLENVKIDWEEKEFSNVNARRKINEELSPKSEVKGELTNDYSLILTESVENTENAFTKEGGSEISCKDTKIDVDHSYEKPFQCGVCNKCFSRAGHLNEHKRIHTGEKPYQCGVCNANFGFSSSLENHKRIHTGEKPYHCDVCNKCFSMSINLNMHKRIHTGEKPYQCDVCNKCFSQEGNLNQHKLTHTGEKPYQCDVCNKCFSRAGLLNNHKLTHTGEKPYQCDICNARFSDASTSRRHKRIHTGEKPYQCDVCNKSFSQAGYLNRHKRTHTGEKPYQCDVCNKCFSESFNLNTHKRVHIGEKPNQCDICNARFIDAFSLINHKRLHT